MVKWFVGTKKDRTLYIEREVIAGPVELSDYDLEHAD